MNFARPGGGGGGGGGADILYLHVHFFHFIKRNNSLLELHVDLIVDAHEPARERLCGPKLPQGQLADRARVLETTPRTREHVLQALEELHVLDLGSQ